MSVCLASKSFSKNRDNKYVYSKTIKMCYDTPIVFYNNMANGWLDITSYTITAKRLWYNIYDINGVHHGCSNCTKFFMWDFAVISIDLKHNQRSGVDFLEFNFDLLGF
jgi:hypothetical protein